MKKLIAKVAWTLGTALIFLAAGCASRDVYPDTVGLLEVGKTTKSEAVVLLGAPNSQRVNNAGFDEWIYRYPTGERAKADTQSGYGGGIPEHRYDQSFIDDDLASISDDSKSGKRGSRDEDALLVLSFSRENILYLVSKGDGQERKKKFLRKYFHNTGR
ncbi:hypothetical protein ACFL4G_08200 [Thermodesulfobacteriota bacterium]